MPAAAHVVHNVLAPGRRAMRQCALSMMAGEAFPLVYAVVVGNDLATFFLETLLLPLALTMPSSAC